MRRVLAVAMVAVRQMIWKLLLILAGVVSVELILFYRLAVNDMMENEFGRYLDIAFFPNVYWVAVLLIFVFQVLQGMDSHGKLTYTLRRLPMGEQAVTTIWALVHMMTYWILWAVQLAVVLICWRSYSVHCEIGPRALELFTQFYRDPFLHGLLPLENYGRSIVNILFVVTLGVSAAFSGFCDRNRKKNVLPVISFSLLINRMSSDYRDDVINVFLIVICLVVTGLMIIGIWRCDYEKI